MKLTDSTKIYRGSSSWNGKVFRGQTLIWPTESGDTPYEKQYFTIEAFSGTQTSVIYYFPNMDGISTITGTGRNLEYRINNGNWIEATFEHEGQYRSEEIPITLGDKIEFKGVNKIMGGSSFAGPLGQYWKVYGNIFSLINGDNFINIDYTQPSSSFIGSNSYWFDNLFDAGEYDYGTNYSIVDCSNLIIPSTNRYWSGSIEADACFQGMFSGCYNLKYAPKLPAPVITYYNYSNMFNGCNNLERLECLATEGLDGRGTANWLKNAGTNTHPVFVKHPDAQWPTSDAGIPSGWTIENAVIG